MANEKEEAQKKVRRPQALKRDLQSEKRRLHNRAFRSKYLTAVRSLETSISKKEPEAKQKLSAVFALADKGVKTGIFKLNKAARMKSRFTAQVAKV